MMARSWIAIASAAALMAAAAWGKLGSRSVQHSAQPAAAQSESFAADAQVRDLDISFYERRVGADTMSAADLAQLAQLYLQRAREAGDLADYHRAEDAARRSLALRGSRNAKAEVVRASSLLALHRFPEALAAAAGLCDDLPARPSACALLAEIQLELGDYDAARATFDRLAPFRGNLGVAPRVARWYEITGRTQDAFRLLVTARADAMRRDDLPLEQVAWFHLRVSDIALRNGNLGEARRALRSGLRVAPADPRLLATAARLAALRHDWREVIELGERVGARADIATLAVIGDAHAALGHAVEAESWYQAIEQAAQDNPEPFNRQWTLFRLDHDRQVAPTMSLLRDEIRVRQDVYGWDQLAWALYRTGDYAEARAAMTQALRMGTRDAVLFFHAGLIERALGNDVAAERLLREAVTLNPHFHPNFPARAQEILDSLRADP
jgi:tetratricopeptide (TPR) repeat protein